MECGGGDWVEKQRNKERRNKKRGEKVLIYRNKMAKQRLIFLIL